MQTSAARSNAQYLRALEAVQLTASGMHNCRFHEFPEDISRLIFETAAGTAGRPNDYLLGRKSTSPWSLALVSKRVKGWTEPLLYHRIHVSAGDRGRLLKRTVRDHPSKAPDFFTIHVKQLVFDGPTRWPTSTFREIAKACTGVRSLTDYSAGVAYRCRLLKEPCTWTRHITQLEVKVGVWRTPPLAWIQDMITDIESLTHLRELVGIMPPSLQVLGITLFLHSPIGQDDLLEVVRDIIKVDIRIVVALWPAGSVSDEVRRVSVVRTRAFQWHMNDEFWDEAGEEVQARRKGTRKWPPEPEPAQVFDTSLIDRWRSMSMHGWGDLGGVE
ncbi:hypothetical protein FA13DRAFT_625209 [Coprinellus micaceus]|uniref:Uncharacterized protein n=1 Tax=Coprinellus micaceus TaxID=71717 RepID=A0A4Y7T6E3_COPMI|nr:hypothetical protein FA13DRAFT_625209 [Coprinellus micaceus]